MAARPRAKGKGVGQVSPAFWGMYPFVNSDRKPEPSYYPALAAFDIRVDRKPKLPVLPLAIATVRRTIANARLRTELTKGCTLGSPSPPL